MTHETILPTWFPAVRIAAIGAALCATVTILFWSPLGIQATELPGLERSNAPPDAGPHPSAPPKIRARVAPAAAGATSGSITGRVVDARDGAPLPDVAVVAWQLPLDALAPRAGALLEPRRAASVAAARAVSGEDGRFALAGLARDALTELAVDAGTARARVVPVRAVLPSDTALDVGDVELAEGCAVRGRVLGPLGRPVAGAWVGALRAGAAAPAPDDGLLLVPGPPAVVLSRPRATPGRSGEGTRAGEDGRFVLLGLSGERERLAVRAGGMREHVRHVELEAGEVDLGDVVLEALDAVRGHVRDARGRPVPDAEVRMASAAHSQQLGMAFGHPLGPPARTTPGGDFEAAAEPGSPQFVAVRAGGRPFWHVAGPFGDGVPLEVALPAQASGVVTLVAEDGGPIERAQLAFQPSGTGGTSLDPLASPLGFSWAVRERRPLAPAMRFTPAGDLAQRLPGESARWRLAGWPAGDYRLLVEAPGYAPVGGWIRLEPGKLTGLELRASRAFELQLELTGAGGAPVAGARVFWRAAAAAAPATDGEACQLPPSALPIAVGTSDAGGLVRGDALGRRDGAFVALHPDHAPAELRVTPRDGERVRIALVPYGAVAGHVGGYEPARLVVVATPSERGALSGGAKYAFPSNDGAFTFVRLTPGRWTLAAHPRSGSTHEHALPRSRALASAEVDVAPGLHATVALRVTQTIPGGRILGRVAVHGQPRIVMSVRAQPLGPLHDAAEHESPGNAVAPPWSQRARSVRTGEGGAFEINGLAPGHYRLTVADVGAVHHPLWSTHVRVSRGSACDHGIQLRLEEVQLSVRDLGGHAVGGMEVLLVGRTFDADGWSGSGVHHRAFTDSLGRAVLPRVPAGHYEVSARCDHQPLVVAPVHLEVGSAPGARVLQALPRGAR